MFIYICTASASAPCTVSVTCVAMAAARMRAGTRGDRTKTCEYVFANCSSVTVRASTEGKERPHHNYIMLLGWQSCLACSSTFCT